MRILARSYIMLVVLVGGLGSGTAFTVLLLICKGMLHHDHKPLNKEEPLLITLAFRLRGHRQPIKAVAFNRNSEIVFTSSCDYTIKAWNFRTQKELFTIQEIDVVGELVISLDGRLLASAIRNYAHREPPGQIKLYNAKTGLHLKTLSGHKDNVYGLAFSPNGKRLISGGGDSTVRVWDVESGECLATLSEPREPVVGVAYSPDGHYVACGGNDSMVRIWDARTFRQIHACPEPGADDPLSCSAVNNVAFSPDSKNIASATYGAAMIRDVRTGMVIHRMNGHSDYVHPLAYSSDGKLLATGSADETVKIWDTMTGQVLASIPHGQQLLVVSFSPDGRYLVTDDWHSSDLLVWELHFADP